MITRLGLIGVILVAVGMLLAYKIIPFSEPLRSLLLCAIFLSVGMLALFRTDRVISPAFASSLLNLWILRCVGLLMLLFGLAGFVGFLGSETGFW